MKNAGKIEIFNDFTYINMPDDEAEIILQVFKNLNREKPLVVKAKESKWWNKTGNRGRRDGFRWNERRKKR